MHAQTWASYIAVYRFGSLSAVKDNGSLDKKDNTGVNIGVDTRDNA